MFPEKNRDCHGTLSGGEMVMSYGAALERVFEEWRRK